MRYNPLNILLGIFVLFILSYSLTLITSFFYLKFVSKKKQLDAKMLFGLVTFALVWVVVTLLTFLATSGLGLLVFALLSLIIIFAIGYLYSTRLLLLDGKHKIIYSLILAILINPAWLFAFTEL